MLASVLGSNASAHDQYSSLDSWVIKEEEYYHASTGIIKKEPPDGALLYQSEPGQDPSTEKRGKVKVVQLPLEKGVYIVAIRDLATHNMEQLARWLGL